MNKFDQLSPLLFRLIDLTSVTAASYLAYYIRFGNLSLPDRFLIATIIGALLVAFFTSYKAAYTSWRGHYGFQLAGRLLGAWTLAGASLLTVLVLTHQGEYFSRIWLTGWWLIGLAMALVARLAVYSFLAIYRARGHNRRRVVLLGQQQSCRNVESQLQMARWSGFDVVASYCTNDDLNIKNLIENLNLNSLADEVWLVASLAEGDWVKKVMFELRNNTQNVRYVPDVSDLRLLNHKVSQIAGIQVMDMSLSPMDGMAGLIKRLEDIVLGIGIFIMVSPIMLGIALAVKLTSPGPVLFKQKRNGIDGKPIKVYKFRSMKIHQETVNRVTQATKNDPRITPLGRFLRRTSLDELPQFYNVIQGRMSIVGPRPHAIQHNEYYRELVESYMRRHKVKPGITGWAQVNGLRGETETLEKMAKRVEYDLFYIDNWSVWLDLKIIIMTIFKGFFNKNAY
ncbi:undecaprenyl-phosphate glucose phosphotransferase [Saccharospirillum alexandrii]|uniref:undecaprenyl-phosphate glucose phosphotransferase n=1 Tax=Saccharospirillum alexandrii TaxID=2448477 RepID=UPI000FD985CD|nr:undecaprenyl-phosphate glucose phosphotransferase [Saccharospirillum alexandrii]